MLETMCGHRKAVFALAAGLIGASVILAARKWKQQTDLKLALLSSQMEVEHLTDVLSYERTARDLLDRLGHSLASIVVAAELAHRLIDQDTVALSVQIAAIEDVARGSLSELRQLICAEAKTDHVALRERREMAE